MTQVPLEDYESKRDFRQTPEPGPVVKSSPGGNLFVIQKHAAGRLHYDLRLELDGTLKSWAVPKGPSLDPAEKRLAVHVEDHPLDYADFEGVIPAGEYGAGTVIIWDRGRWFPEGESAADPAATLRAGKLKFRLEGEKLHGAWMLVRLANRRHERQESWLLFKERDDEARQADAAAVTTLRPESVVSGRLLEQVAAAGGDVKHAGAAAPAAPPTATPASGSLDLAPLTGARRAAMPARLEPELATLVAVAPPGDDWLHEIKFDGYRIMGRLEDGTARLLTRRGVDWTARLPGLGAALQRLPAERAYLDGEVVYQKPDGRTSFRELAGALQAGAGVDEHIVYYVFDLLYINGFDLTRVPLVQRKEALRVLLAGTPPQGRVRYVDHLRGAGAEFFRQSCALGLEGEVAKRSVAPYRPGRGRDWLKVKCLHRQEFVIGGFSERTGDGGVGALLLGFRRGPDEPLAFAGRVGTGWDEQAVADLRQRLDALRQDEATLPDVSPGESRAPVIWVRPELVAEVEYLSWDDHGGFRHASFEGLRFDKPARDVVVEAPVATALEPLAPAAEALAPPPEETAVPAGAAVSELETAGEAVTPGAVPPRRAPRPRAAAPVTVGGVVITHPDRVVYPGVGLTKLEVARYYDDIAAWILPHLARRPLSLVRCPEWHGGACFYQKHAVAQFPEAILRVPIRERKAVATYVAVDSVAGLLSLVQMNVLEFHVWGARLDDIERPDQIVFDLDPDPALPFAHVVEAARLVRDALADLGLRSFVRTTGGKGLHVVAPILPTRRWEEVRPVTRAIAEAIAGHDPARYISTMSLEKRAGKIFIDYLRNGRGATAIATYSTRRRPGAPVAVPLRWDELTARLRSDTYTVGNVRRRLAHMREDPWHDYGDLRQEISPQMAAAAAALFPAEAR